MGTPFYMSPEQCRAERLDTRSDIYSLGVVAYRLLTGETPFQGSPEEVIELHKTAEPAPLRERNRKVPRKMARLVMSALAKDPAERPQSAAGFASAMRASWEGPAISCDKHSHSTANTSRRSSRLRCWGTHRSQCSRL